MGVALRSACRRDGRLVGAKDQLREEGGCLLLHSWNDVLVDGHRECRVGVTEPLAHDLHRNTGSKEEGRVRVPEIVQRNHRQTQPDDGAIEGLAESVRVGRRSVGPGKDEIVVGEGRPDQQPFGQGRFPPPSQHTDGAGVEVDGAAPCPGLHVGHRDLVGDRDDRLADGEPGLVEVDVGPAEPEDLATTGEQAGGLLLHARDDVLVDGHRERRVGVAEALADDLHRNASPQRQRGVGTAEVVEGDHR